MNSADLLKKRYLIMGLGISGYHTAKFLIERGVKVFVSDISESVKDKIEDLKNLANKKNVEFDYKIGEQDEKLFKNIDVILLSPGIRSDSEIFKIAGQKGILITNDIQLFYWIYKKDVIGVTGSNGKSTTVSLISHILKKSDVKNKVAGNIGRAVFELSDDEVKENEIVLELSSFQLETMIDFRPKFGVLLNITPDHLDRHPDFKTYMEAKLNIFKNQLEGDIAILNDILPEYSFLKNLKSQKFGFSTVGELKNFTNGVFVKNNKIYFKLGEKVEFVGKREDVFLMGEHNLENFLASYLILRLYNIKNRDIFNYTRDFKSLPHRLEFVGEIDGVKCYNDSKATNVESAIKGIGSFNSGVHLILGGKDKKTDLTPLIDIMKGRVLKVYLIGEASERFSKAMGNLFEKEKYSSLEDAMYDAFKCSKKGEVVLLSPACASFDMFKNFEDRGNKFKKIFKELKKSENI